AGVGSENPGVVSPPGERLAAHGAASLAADVPDERVRVDGVADLRVAVGTLPRGPVARIVGMPLEVVVGDPALGVARVTHVPDHRAGGERLVVGEARVVRVLLEELG